MGKDYEMVEIREEELQKIEKWLEDHREEFVSDLAGFVAIPSVSVKQEGEFPFGKACADNLNFFVKKAEAFGIGGENLENYAARARLAGTVGEKTLGIFGHGDVVPAVGEWEQDPFQLWVKDGEWLVGRGAGDNKSACLGALYALRYLKEQGIELKNNVDLYVGSAEETGSEDMVYLTQHYQMPDFSLVPDAGFPVCSGEKGILEAAAQRALRDTNLADFSGGEADNIVAPSAWALLKGADYEEVSRLLAAEERISTEATPEGVRIHSRGIAQHSAFPDGSIDAIGQLARVLDRHQLVTGDGAEAIRFIARATEGYYGEGLGIAFSDEPSGKLTSMLTRASMEDGVLWISFNIRYSVTADGTQLTAILEKQFDAAGFDRHSIHDNPGFYRQPDEKARLLSELSNAVLHQEMGPYTLAGGTYARKLPNAVGYGFGNMQSGRKNPFPLGQGGGHQPNETVNLYTVMDGIKIYILALQALDALL